VAGIFSFGKIPLFDIDFLSTPTVYSPLSHFVEADSAGLHIDRI
jgi:hypothetical protein